MKIKTLWISICLAALFCITATAWSQDPSAQPDPVATEQPAAVQEQPAAVQEQPAAVQEPAAAVQEPGAMVQELAVCQDVVDRTPVASSDVFPKETGKIFCFSRVVGAEVGTKIMHNWYHDGSLKASVKLNVHSTNFRTWSSKRLVPEWTGEWMVEVLDQDGKALDSIVFTVQ